MELGNSGTVQGRLRAQPVSGTRGSDWGLDGKVVHRWKIHWSSFQELQLPECRYGNKITLSLLP